MINYYIILSFDHPCISNMFMRMKLCQTQPHIHIDSPSTNNDSNNEVLETLSNLYPTFGQKILLSYLEMRIYKMPSLLTRSDQFYVD